MLARPPIGRQQECLIAASVFPISVFPIRPLREAGHGCRADGPIGQKGLVKVGVSAGVGMRRLPLVLDALKRSNPAVEQKREAVESAETMRRLQAATLDVGIVASEAMTAVLAVLAEFAA